MTSRKNVDGPRSGTVMCLNVVQPPAPSMLAASYTSGGMPCRPAR
jgi:hypothetical protein